MRWLDWARDARFAVVAAAVVGVATAPARAAAAQEGGAEERRVDFRLQQRTRYESLNDQFRPGLSGSDQILALQTSLFIEAGRGDVRFFGELMDARAELNDAGSFVTTTNVNTLEPLQAYGSWTFRDVFRTGSTATLRAGRLTMNLGRRRLLARSGFRNTITSFTGIDWEWRGADGSNARAFYVVPMRILPRAAAALLDNDRELDRANRDTGFRGAYYLFPAFGNGDRVELFWLGLDQGDRPQNDAAPRDLDTLGFRFFRPTSPGQWSYEVEAVWQRGESSATAAGVRRTGLDHDGHFHHWELGYAFAARWSPVLLLQYDYASGDEDPFDDRNDGFDTLFGERRFDFAPQGIYGAFARGNLRTPGVRLTFRPRPRWQAMLSYRSFELAAARDAWSGVGLRDLTGQSGRSIGTQLEGSFNWSAIEDRLSLEAGFAELAAGRFLREASGPSLRGNPTYIYLTLTTNL